MLSIVILICAADVERSACTQRTALLVTPVTTASAGCGLDAQALIASHLQIETGQYVKVLCTRGGGGKIETRVSVNH